MSNQRKTGIWLVAAAAMAALGYAILGPAFDWPAILDESGSVALPAYITAETAVRAGFLAQLAGSLLLIPAAVYANAAWGRRTPGDLTLTAFGILGATLQTLGWARWPIAMPDLAARYTEATSSAQQAVVVGDYDLLNSYAGGTVGEFLGWLFQAVWAVGLAWWLLKRSDLPRWLSAPGLAVAAVWAVALPGGIALGLESAEFVGVNVYTLWFVWLLIVGGVLLGRRPTDTTPPDRTSADVGAQV